MSEERLQGFGFGGSGSIEHMEGECPEHVEPWVGQGRGFPQARDQVVVGAEIDESSSMHGHALLLLTGFRALIDRLHTELARQGHPNARPAHGFALQAIGPRGATASVVGHRLGISKQAAGKTVDRLEHLGYVERVADQEDARRKLIRLTPRGLDLLARSAAIFDDLRTEWAEAVGAERLRALEDGLRTVTGDSVPTLDTVAWLERP